MSHKMSNQQWDVAFGILGTAGTLSLSFINVMLGCMAGVLTVCVMGLRLRKEWKDRDK